MRVLSAVLDAFSGSKTLVELDGPPAAGEALAIARALITDLCETQLWEIRQGSKRGHMEAVIECEHLDEYSQILAAVFGEPCKPFGMRAKFEGPLSKRVKTIGGVMRKQCLYLRRFEDDRVAYATLWPWEDGDMITLKVGVFEEPLPAPSRD